MRQLRAPELSLESSIPICAREGIVEIEDVFADDTVNESLLREVSRVMRNAWSKGCCQRRPQVHTGGDELTSLAIPLLIVALQEVLSAFKASSIMPGPGMTGFMGRMCYV